MLTIGSRVRHVPSGRVGVVVSVRNGRALVLVAGYGYLVYAVDQWREVRDGE